MPGYLALEDGSIFTGRLFGADREAEGEVVFTTGMTGYQEVLTDPSYCGQIVVMTYPLIGNYGVNDQDLESFFSGVRGFVVREKSDAPSHWRMTRTLEEYLYERGLPGLEGIDTRALTRRLRQKGTLQGLLTSRLERALAFCQGVASRVELAGTLGPDEILGSKIGIVPAEGAQAPVESLAAGGGRVAVGTAILGRPAWPWLRAGERLAENHFDSLVGPGQLLAAGPDPGGLHQGGKDRSRQARVGELVAEVTTPTPYKIFGQGPEIVAVDFGIKGSILRALVERDCSVTVVPAWTPLEEILDLEPDGVLLSNGPGDPKDVLNGIEVARGLVEKQVPLFGICLGHQILALALGGDTYKLKYGHRGVNHPVKDLASQRVYITTQNHGYAVDPQSLPAGEVSLTHVNLNDGTVEGFAHRHRPVFSVQFHPEGSPGPTETGYLFDRFLELVRNEGKR